jgi:hypothetical protein
MADSTTTRASKKPGIRVRGYQLRVTYLDWRREDSGLMWLPAPPLESWEAAINNPEVRYATLIRSGRVWQSYDLMRVRMYAAPLNSNQGFSLMR